MTLLEQEILRLLAAAGLGAVIGIERERVDRGAGLRTHALVSTASALFTLISAYGFEDIVTLCWGSHPAASRTHPFR